MHISRPTFPLAVAAATAALAVVAAASAQAAAVLPSASTGTANGVTFSAATLTGTVDPKGVETVALFQYGATRTLGSETPITPIGNGRAALAFGSPISGLTPATTYYYRIVATGGGGSSTGAIKTFSTPPIPLTVSLATTPNPVVFGNPFIVEGTLAGTGSGNHEVVLQANPFPFTGGFQTVGNPQVTSVSGGFQFPFIGLEQTAQLRVATVDNPPVVSAIATETVAVRVTLTASGTGRTGFESFTGSVSPAEPLALFAVERLKPRKGFVTVAGGLLASGGTRFGKTVKVQRGVYRVFIQTSGGAQVSSVSPAVSLR